MCRTLWDPMACSLPVFSVYGIFQARILEWVAISFSRGSSRPRDGTRVSRIAGRHFTISAIREDMGNNTSNIYNIYICKILLKFILPKFYQALSSPQEKTWFEIIKWKTNIAFTFTVSNFMHLPLLQDPHLTSSGALFLRIHCRVKKRKWVICSCMGLCSVNHLL